MTQSMEQVPGRNQPCPCGSGKKHKRCCGTGVVTGHQKLGSWKGLLIGVGVIALFVVGGNIVRERATTSGMSGSGSVGPPEYADIFNVDLSRLSVEQRAQVMRDANRQRCACGCGMTLAQCINTDMTCPLRDRNFQRARQLVAQTEGSS